MKKNRLLIAGISILGLGLSTVWADTTTSQPASMPARAAGADQIVTPVPTPHHHHHAKTASAKFGSQLVTNSGAPNSTVVGMAAPTATPTGSASPAPMGVPTSIPLKP
jgi:hypothetical protein